MKSCPLCGNIPIIEFCEDECNIACDNPECKLRIGVSVHGVNSEQIAIKTWNEIADKITKIGGKEE